MKILSGTYLIQSNIQAFKGLWGKPHNDTSVGYDCIYSRSDEFYYPFKDETNEQISNVVKTKHKSLITGLGETSGDVLYFRTFVNVKKALPFTEEEFRNYKLGQYNDDKDVFQKELIENTLDKNGLEKYKTSDEEKEDSAKGIKGFFKKFFLR